MSDEVDSSKSFPERLRDQPASAGDIHRLQEILQSTESTLQSSIQALGEQVTQLNKRVGLVERRESRTGWLYSGLFVVAALLTGYLLVRGAAVQPTVSIDFDVGAIIAGVLGGGSAVVASAAYLRRAGRE